MNPSALPRSRAPAMAQTLIASASLDLRSESPDQPSVRVLLGALDDHLGSLYEPQHNHILGVDEQGYLALLEAGAAQTQAVGLYERAGYRRRAAFAGYPGNGLSLFYEKQLGR